jgi:hypothetical protein
MPVPLSSLNRYIKYQRLRLHRTAREIAQRFKQKREWVRGGVIAAVGTLIGWFWLGAEVATSQVKEIIAWGFCAAIIVGIGEALWVYLKAPSLLHQESEQKISQLENEKAELVLAFDREKAALSEQLQSRADRRKIIDGLVLLIQEGYEHHIAVNNYPTPIPVADINDWGIRAALFLGEHLGEAYKIEFQTCPDGLPSPYKSVGKIVYSEHAHFYGYLYNRLELLKGYLKKLNDAG